MSGRKTICWSLKINLVLFVASLVIAISSHRVAAAEKITFRYGIATHSVSYADLETFAKTGKMSPSLKFLFKFSEQDPRVVRWILTQQFPADVKIISDVLNSAPGEYILDRTTSAVATRSDRANAKALRGALITSASDDRRISLLEVLDNYPTHQVYVDGKLLSQMRRNFLNFVVEAEKYIKIPTEIIQDFLNNS